MNDTGFPKKGNHSVGVARQYRGRLGKRDNCRVAVTLSVANEAASLPVAYRLNLPQAWAEDAARRRKAGVPEEIRFVTKPEISLEQIKSARVVGIPAGVVLADAGYGTDTEFRDGLSAQGLAYAVGVLSTTNVWEPGMARLPAKAYGGVGRPPKLLRRAPGNQPVSVKDLALALPETRYRTITRREGTVDLLRSRFAAVRVRPAHRDTGRASPRPEEWLLIEWPVGRGEPSKYVLSTLPVHAPLKELVATVKLRWRSERDYQDFKQELGLGHYEGRGWRGFHHHATLCIAAYGFLVSERSRIPPSGTGWRPKPPRRPKGFRPRGAPCLRQGSGRQADPTRMPHPELDRNLATTPRRRTRTAPATMSLPPATQSRLPLHFMA